jgi:acyl-CoA reductase-like NAD-dependent aldehyde dehydrogenase
MSLYTPEHPAGLPIGDEWVKTSTEQIKFPFDGEVVASAPIGDAELAKLAISNAVKVRRVMAKLPSRVRRQWLRETYSFLASQREEFERLLVLETGKPLRDCKVEVARALVTLETSADEVARLHGETVQLDLLPTGDGMTGFWQRKPIGVVVGITGFNYPLLLAVHKLGPAIAAGCPIILKTAPATPLATLWLVHVVREVARRLGAPVSAVQLVTGDAAVGESLTTDPRIGVVSFTGSSKVGHQIARAAAPRKVLLELGSNAALIIDDSANVAAAADAAVRGGYYASGQACIAIQRILALDSVADEFLSLLTRNMKRVVVGDPREESTQVSALINEGSTSRVLEWIREAERAGSRIVIGGSRNGSCIAPTVLADVPDGVNIWDEEVFGPVVCVRRVPDLQTAIDMVNMSRFGLHASIFTESIESAFRCIDELEVGGVVVNEVPGYRSDTMPYGGVKDSGIGREGPRFAIEEFTVTRMAIIRPSVGE